MKASVLFVDDDASFLDGLRRMLRSQRSRWDMTFAASVDAALNHLEERGADAIVSDVMLPGRDGFDLLNAVKESARFGHVPVVMMTGSGERDLKRRALDEGAADLLSKPVDAEELTARVRNALRLKTYQDRIRRQNDFLERRVLERTKALDASRIDLIWRLGRVAEFRDEQTGNHIMRVGLYCKTLAETLGMPRDFAEMIYLTSPLHDIGKIGIPDGILLASRKLTCAEWEVMRKHCTIGAEILRHDVGMRSHLRLEANPFLEMASSIAQSHHEWWDGTGYPQRLSGEGIPLAARIVAVADVYDALSSARPYKPAFPEETVLGLMGQKAGSHFDPAVYEAFRRSLTAFREIFRQMSGEDAKAA